MPSKICIRMLTIVVIVLLGGIAAASLVRFCPGYGMDDRILDSRLNSDSIRAMRRENSSPNVWHFYAGFLRGILQGQLGESRTFEQPISTLLDQRWRVSAGSILSGLTLAWLIVLSFAGWIVASQNHVASLLSSALTGTLLSVPTALAALLAANNDRAPKLVLLVVLVPVLFRYTRNILQHHYNQLHVIAARARGVSAARLLVRHTLPNAAPELFALGGISFSLAFGALIPIEFLCGSPGVGQLALQAALGRDLPLLVVLTGIVTTITLFANLTAEIMSGAFCPFPA